MLFGMTVLAESLLTSLAEAVGQPPEVVLQTAAVALIGHMDERDRGEPGSF